jgi:hypothetical protein
MCKIGRQFIPCIDVLNLYKLHKTRFVFLLQVFFQPFLVGIDMFGSCFKFSIHALLPDLKNNFDIISPLQMQAYPTKLIVSKHGSGISCLG